ncbi:MBL fold metallo-hydrolase [Candidatus Poseidoniaceae archaeon]|nr:MBL fold metallo-hydrolase [Candidatus Poseidoniaceae archaeon]|tara:strand:- start:2049 stop:2810 length:762 start_codon:yes stop_codon:yes gene_type:complete
MRITRLPAIHHDSNIVVVKGSASSILIDVGTSWYQMLQVERIIGVLGDEKLDRILLTSRLYPFAGGSKYVSQYFDNAPVHIHEEGQAALQTGDFFTTWANRYESDMPSIETSLVEDGEIFVLGDCEVEAVLTNGISSDGMSYYISQENLLIAGGIVIRADRPCRWDLPGANLVTLRDNLKKIMLMKLSAIVPMQGPAIKGKKHVAEVLKRHLEFYQSCIDDGGTPPSTWARPARSTLWLTPRTPWPLEEKESA